MPDHYEARRLQGQLELAEGRAEEALPDLEWAVARRPYDTLAREALGRTLARWRTDEAKVHLDFVVEAGEQMADGWSVSRIARKTQRRRVTL